jgi:DNA-binding IclR family transcriptional regulator
VRHDDKPRSGTQSIERVVAVLRVVASRGRHGMRLGDVAAASGLPVSTCLRMLQRLEIEGLLERHPVTRQYFLGPLLHELGLLARPRIALAERCEATLAQVADETHDTVYLSERRGLEAVCSARALGNYPIKALTLDVGIRRPLGVGAGGLAILCAMAPAEADEVIEANAQRYAKLSTLDAARVRDAVREGRERGHAFLDSAVFHGVAAVGVAFPAGAPVAAISVTAISARLDEARRETVATVLRKHVRALERGLAHERRPASAESRARAPRMSPPGCRPGRRPACSPPSLLSSSDAFIDGVGRRRRPHQPLAVPARPLDVAERVGQQVLQPLVAGAEDGLVETRWSRETHIRVATTRMISGLHFLMGCRTSEWKLTNRVAPCCSSTRARSRMSRFAAAGT